MKPFSWIKTPLSMMVRTQQISYAISRRGAAAGLKDLGIEVGKRGFALITRNQPTSRSFDSIFGKRLAATFIDLGPTFIKLGQMLAQRPDWVGEDIARELRILFDRIPGISYRKVEKILKSEWGKDKFRKAILKIEKKPLASASLSQTHVASLRDGREVILKVQKPKVEQLVRLDLQLIESAVTVLETLYPKLSLKLAFNDFKQATLREIDYREEAKNIDRFQKNNRTVFSSSSVVFPNYEKDLLTKRVIALAPMRGKKASELKNNSRAAKRAARLGATAVLEQIFEHGFFHADPHAGNLFFLEDSGKLGFIDLGLVGQLEPQDRLKFSRVMLAIVKRDRNNLARSLYALGVAGKTTQYSEFELGIQKILDGIKSKGMKNIKINKVVDELFEVAHSNQIYIPNRYLMMIRSCLMIEGVAKELDKDISLVGLAAPILTRTVLKNFNPLRILRLGK
ncbi:MAG: AarF/ABC1/UbiB kinase family protein [Deltaproteobacteria bacterium]|nr:AarF/ABC1/UbiB kinase family protein [Deltaproteobacteria bacterium]